MFGSDEGQWIGTRTGMEQRCGLVCLIEEREIKTPVCMHENIIKTKRLKGCACYSKRMKGSVFKMGCHAFAVFSELFFSLLLASGIARSNSHPLQ